MHKHLFTSTGTFSITNQSKNSCLQHSAAYLRPITPHCLLSKYPSSIFLYWWIIKFISRICVVRYKSALHFPRNYLSMWWLQLNPRNQWWGGNSIFIYKLDIGLSKNWFVYVTWYNDIMEESFILFYVIFVF